ncbi:MAG: DUF2157 domain-containing protein [Rhodocyclales bacterium]|nr:DUF2157 domain-containing protein [Rhodocyclales bacterium]
MTSNRIEAQQRVDAIRAFSIEMQRLEREQVVLFTDDQHRAIASHHDAQLTRLARDFDIDHNARAKQLSLGMRIVSLLGALALAASVFFLFYQFWGWFPTTAQIATLVSASLASFAATFWIARKDSTGYFAKLAAMVAFACFVLNISMLGQIFNITPSDKALLPWATLALLLAYALDLRLLLVAGMLCLIAFLAARVGTWSGMYWLDFGERPENFFPAAVALFFVPLWADHHRHAGFAQAYRIVALLTLFLPMLVLANWGGGSYLALNTDLVEGLYQTLGFAGSAIVTWLGVRKQWNEVTNTCVTFFLLFMYTKMFDWWWDAMPKYLFFLILGLTAVLLLLVLRRMRGAAAWTASEECPA